MKKNNFKNFLISLIFIFVYSNAVAETKVRFVDMDILIKNSSAGKSLLSQLDKKNKDNKMSFDKSRKKLSEKKKKITAQKNVLTTEEYNKKVKALNDEFEKFKVESENEIRLLAKKRDDGMLKILNELNIILSEHSNENNLTFIIDQKNIIIGKTDLNITETIMKKLNNKINKIKLN